MQTDWSNYSIIYDGVTYDLQYRDKVNLIACEDYTPNSPSPNYPSPINSVSNFDLLSTDGINQTQTINFPYTLRSLPDGTKDYIEIDNVNKTAKLYRNIGIATLGSGTEWTIEEATSNSSIRCTHLTNSILVDKTLTSSTSITSDHNVIYELATPTVTDLDYNEAVTYYPYTQIYTNAEIQPTLDGKIRIIDRGEE